MRPLLMFAIGMLALVALAPQGDAILSVKFINKCEKDIVLFHTGPGTQHDEKFPKGATLTKFISDNSDSNAYRSTTQAQATLAEITTKANGKFWYDISVIPTGNGIGPGECTSLEDCKQRTGGTGFNVAMEMKPIGGKGERCVTLRCDHEKCPDGYQFPKDDSKTHVCENAESLEVTFCSNQPTLLTLSTPSPTPTPPPSPPPTPAPTPTPTPTPSPTATAPPTLSPDAQLENGLIDKSLRGSGSGGSGVIGHDKEDRDLDSAITTPPPTPAETDRNVEATPAPSPTEGKVVEVKTKSENRSTGPEVYVISILGCVGVVAGAVIVVLRKKKQELDALEQKSPLPTVVASKSMVMVTPNETTVL